MFFNVTGLDIDARSVRAVLVTLDLRGKERVKAAAGIDISEAGGLGEAIRRIFENKAFRQATCISAISAEDVSFRNLTLPFTDEKKIRQALPYALEPMLQTPIEDGIIDFKVVHARDKAEIFAAVVSRELVRERLGMLAGNGQAVAVLDIETVPVAAVLAARCSPSDAGVVIDVGERKTVAVWFSSKKILHVRCFAFGCGADSETRADSGISGPSDDFPRFLSDLNRTFAYLDWQGLVAIQPWKIYLTGQGALDASLCDRLSQSLNMTVEPLNLFAVAGIEVDAGAMHDWNPFLMTRALALAMRSSLGGFNFGRREITGQADLSFSRKQIRTAAMLAALILALGGINVWLDYRYDALRLEALKSQVKAVFRAYAPEVTRIVDPVQQMHAKIDEARKISLGTGVDQSRTTALDTLREISSLTPPSTDFLMTSFDYNGGTAVIKGEAEDFNAVEQIKSELSKSKYFKTVAVGSSNALKEGGKVIFSMRINLK
jgi:type II secretory pathway component PulL